jgi:predicted nucleotidyltransferase
MLRLPLDRDHIADFCRRWRIRELSLFGSVVREDFRPDSDVDVLISFAPDAQWGLFDHVRMEEELTNIIGRPVDLVTRPAVEHSANWIRRREILDTAEPFYVEG